MQVARGIYRLDSSVDKQRFLDAGEVPASRPERYVMPTNNRLPSRAENKVQEIADRGRGGVSDIKMDQATQMVGPNLDLLESWGDLFNGQGARVIAQLG